MLIHIIDIHANPRFTQLEPLLRFSEGYSKRQIFNKGKIQVCYLLDF